MTELIRLDAKEQEMLERANEQLRDAEVYGTETGVIKTADDRVESMKAAQKKHRTKTAE